METTKGYRDMSQPFLDHNIHPRPQECPTGGPVTRTPPQADPSPGSSRTAGTRTTSWDTPTSPTTGQGEDRMKFTADQVQLGDPTPISPELETLFREIAELPENWNSYGAAPISSWSISEARKIISEGMGTGLPVPDISPASGSSVGIEWETANAELVIDVDPRDGITYFISDKVTGEEVEGELTASNRSEVLHQVLGLRV